MARHHALYRNAGCESGSSGSGGDALLMLSTVLNQGQERDFTATLFGLDGNLSERVTVGLYRAVLENMCKTFVQRTEEHGKMFKCIGNTKIFRSSDYARYAPGMNFRKGSIPSGSVADGDKYFPGKDKV